MDKLVDSYVNRVPPMGQVAIVICIFVCFTIMFISNAVGTVIALVIMVALVQYVKERDEKRRAEKQQ